MGAIRSRGDSAILLRVQLYGMDGYGRRAPQLVTDSLRLSPTLARASCLYATDGGTTNTPDGCRRRGRCTARKWWMCNYPPAKLSRMMEAHAAHNCRGWNEVVVTRADWERSLPRLVEAERPHEPI